MQRKSEFVMMAIMILLSVGLVGSVAVSVGLATRSHKADYELIILRKDIEERMDLERKEYLEVIEGLNRKQESETYLNQRRYDLLSEEIESVKNKNK